MFGRLRDYEQVGGHLSLDFANTMGGGRTTVPNEYLREYEDLVCWSEMVGILSKAEAQSLTKAAHQNPSLASEVFARAITLREAIYRLVTAHTLKRSPKEEDLFLVAREASFAMGRAKIVSTKGGFQWIWPESSDLDRMLWVVARSAADLLTSSDLNRVRECGRNECTWVFLDTSKNHSRRWCIMKDCGNREKIRRFRKK